MRLLVGRIGRAHGILGEATIEVRTDEPAEGATTLKKKAQERLAAKANPVVEEAVVETPAVEEAPAAVEAVVVETVEAVVETPAEEAAAE